MPTDSKKLTVLISPIDGIGHFNACIGIAEPLRDRGHRVVFAVPDSWKNKLAKLGFEEELYNLVDPAAATKEEDTEENKLAIWGQIVKELSPAFLMTPLEQIKHMTGNLFAEVIRQAKLYHERQAEIVEKIKPDIIIADAVIHQPAIMDTKIPWILSFSITPAAISVKNVPPAFSGYPTEDRSLWDEFLDEYRKVFKPMYEDVNQWVKENGGPDIPFYDNPLYIKYSPYANIYMYPEELDYTHLRPNPPNFHRFDNFVRSTTEQFEIPEKLRNKPGKLVYLSMGSIGCSEIGLMKRLVSILAKSPHRFIVSKGPLSSKYDLPDNMWGDVYLPQTALLPLVDLVISHGGNNTVTESFHFGKPLLVLPLFGDQPDNAQRVQETGLGLRLHAYKCTEAELLGAVDKLLRDKELTMKMEKIGQRIRASNNQDRVADLIEVIVRNNRI